MSKAYESCNNRIEFSKDLLTSFSIFLADEIKNFYNSPEGKDYYEKWLKKNNKQ